ncbi:MAG: serine hydrolase [Gemmatimonadales bacterium]|nr:serine hydrolase [Gemmatimonadales bacterium]
MRLSIALLLLPGLAFAQAKPRAPAPTAPAPHYPGAVWERRAPAALGLDSTALADAVAFALANESPLPRDLEQAHVIQQHAEPYDTPVGPLQERGAPTGLVIRNGYVAASWGDPARVDMTFSVTKSFLSTVVGVAVDRGLIPSVDQPVIASLGPVRAWGVTGPGEWLAPFDTPHNRQLTWDHMLRQTSDWEGTLWGKPDWADRPQGDPRTWRARVRNAPGTSWKYNDVRVNALAFAATQVWRRPLPAVLREAIMEPIGASRTWRWHGYETSWIELDGQPVQVVSGGGHWGGGLFISAEDMARFGLLTLRGGVWEGKRLLGDAWVRAARTPTVPQPTYGYMNWFLNTGRKLWPSVPEDVFAHIGNGRNLIVCVPQHDMVIVVRWIADGATDAFLAKVLAAVR